MKKLYLLLMPFATMLVPAIVLAQNSNDNSNYGYNMMRSYGDQGYGFRGMMGNSVGPWGMHFLGWIWMLLIIVFWALVIVGIVYLAKYLLMGEGVRLKRNIKIASIEPTDKEDDAIKILKKRFAKGEIDKIEFEEKIKYLRKV